jgi:hypothetical protein
MKCPHCYSVELRNSRFRVVDFFHLLLLRLPVRCRNCQERSYVSIADSREIRRESMVRHANDGVGKNGPVSTREHS